MFTKNLFKISALLVVLMLCVAANTFAQTYVNNTNGDDLVGTGTAINPYKTIAKAIAVTASGGTISIAADTYGEAAITVTKPFTFVATTFNSLSTVTITNGLTINTTNATDVVSLGETGQAFNLGTTAGALVLTKGILNIASANVIIGSAATITRTAGSINNTPTVTNVNVVYNSTVDITAGAELPANIGSGLLNINITAGKTIIVPTAVTTTGGITVTTGNATFSQSLTLSTSSLVNTPAGNAVIINGPITFNAPKTATPGLLRNLNTGTVTVNGNAQWTKDAVASATIIDNNGTGGSSGTMTFNGTVNVTKFTGSGDINGIPAVQILNNGTGTLTFAQGWTVTGNVSVTAANTTVLTPTVDVNNASTGTFTINATAPIAALTNVGTLNLTGGTVSGVVANNSATSKIELFANETFSNATVGNGNAAAIIKLNGNTLTISNAAAAVTNTGTIISTTAATIGSGTVAISGAGATITGGEIPNLTVASGKGVTLAGGINAYGNITSAGAVTLTGNLTLFGNYTQNVGGTLGLAGNTFDAKGNWTRVSNVPGDVTYTTGILQFTGSAAQTLNSGASLILYDVVINKTSATILTLTQTVEVARNFTITSGTLALGDNHVRMTGTGGTFNNTGGYTSSGNGYIIFTPGAAVAQTITGTGLFSNIDVRDGVTLTATSNINFSGNLILRNGTLAIGANTFTYKNDLVAVPSVMRYNTGTMTAAGGTIAVGTGVVYDLTYAGAGNITAAAEWKSTTGMRNLTIATGDATNAYTVTGSGAATVIAGALTVNQDQELALNAADLTLSGANQVHNVVGKVTDAGGANKIIFTGDGSSLVGSSITTATAFAEVPAVDVTITAAQSFTSTLIKVFRGNFTVANGTANVTMNSASTPTVLGNVTLTAGTLNFTAAGAGAVHTGNIVLTAGSMTYTRSTAAAADYTLTGTVTLTAGTFTLGSHLKVSGVTSMVNANVVAAGNNYTSVGAFTRSGSGTWTASTGKLIVAAAGAVNFDPGATAFTVPNFEIANGTGNTVTLVNPFTVSNIYTQTSGTLAMGTNNLSITGPSFIFTAGTYTSGGGIIRMTGVDQVINAAVAPTFINLAASSTGTLTLTTSVSPAAALNFTVSGAFTQSGNISTGIHSVVLGGTFTRTAGTWAQGTGYLVFGATIAGVTQGSGLAVDNLEVDAAVSPTATDAFTVNKYLLLKAGVVTMNTLKVVLGDGCIVERQADGAYISTVPAFTGAISVVYSTAAITTAANFTELPASVTNFTVVTSGSVTLPKNVTVNSTLTLSGILTTTASTKNITMANGGTLVLKANGGTVLPVTDVVRAGTLNITYDGATATSTRELGALNSGATAYTAAAGNVTFKSATVALQKNLTIAGTATFSGGTFDMNGNAVTVQGDVVQTSTGGFFSNGGAAANLTFGGATNTLLTLGQTWQLPASNKIKITISKTNANNTVTLSGGDLDEATNTLSAAPNTLYFVNGVIVTGGTSNVILKQWATTPSTGVGVASIGQPTQGFDRSGVTGSNESHVAGRVKKYVNNDGDHNVDISAVTFPVGSLAPAPYYRPMTYFFKTNPQSSINLTVSPKDTKAGGYNGFPITAGTLSITNYPDFGWYAVSDIPLSPSYKYDVEAQAKGYTDYVNDQIQNVRLVRRDSGSVANPWILQANLSGSTPIILYDNSTIAANWPVVKAIDATGGITTQGSIFSYSQGNKPPYFTRAMINRTVAENVAVVDTFTATDPDLNQTSSLVAVTIPTGATFNASTGVFNWTPNYFQSGSYTVTIRATDGSANKDTTFTITVTDVPRQPSFTSIPRDTTISARQAYSFTYVATSLDTNRVKASNPLKYRLVSPSGATLDSLTGVLNWTPAVGDTGIASAIVYVTDGLTASVYDTARITVAKLIRVPSFTAALASGAYDMGTMVNFTYAAADSDGLAITYSITKNPAAATINATTGALAYYVPFAKTGTYLDTIIVQASNGSKTATSTAVITRNYKNAKPIFTVKLGNRTVNVGDTLTFTYAAIDSNQETLKYFGINYPNGATVDSVTGALRWIAQSSQTAIYIIKTGVTDGALADTTSAEVLVQVLVVNVNVSGTVTYGSSTTGIGAVTVRLTPATGTALTATSSATGAYTITGVPAGTFTLSATKTGNWGGVTGSDALLVARHAAGITPLLTGLALTAADVNNSGSVTAADPQAIVRRAVGLDATFTAGDWVFLSQSVVITNASVTKDISGLAVGDVNASYTPSGSAFTKSPASINLKKGTEKFSVSTTSAGAFGAVSIKINVNSAKVASITSKLPGVSRVDDAGVSFVWFAQDAQTAVQFGANEAIVTVTLAEKASDVSNVTFESEVADIAGAVIDNNLAIAVPEIPTVFSLGQNYPNPFNPSTQISYNLPQAGMVTLSIYNLLGQEVARLVNEQKNAGSYSVEWAPRNMASGMYIYRINVQTEKEQLTSTKRLMLLK